MQFIYSKDSGSSLLCLSTKDYSHIFKVRRVKNGETLLFRNMTDDILYRYKLTGIDKKMATLELLDYKKYVLKAKKALHVGWCVVDPKTIEKTLPFLNELGISKISFVYCDFSQKNFKIDTDRLRRILINSSQQCGRSSLMEFEILKDLDEYLALYPKSKIIDFDGVSMAKSDEFSSFLVGCEGGFSKKEREKMDKSNIIGLDSKIILRSETAILYVTSALN